MLADCRGSASTPGRRLPWAPSASASVAWGSYFYAMAAQSFFAPSTFRVFRLIRCSREHARHAID